MERAKEFVSIYERTIEGEVIPLQDLAGINIAATIFSVNRRQLVVSKQDRYGPAVFVIHDPHKLSVNLSVPEFRKLEKELIKKGVVFESQYIPRYWAKNPGAIFTLTLELGHFRFKNESVQLLDFGGSYGEISVNGIPCTISHCGGSAGSKYEALGYRSQDTTWGFHVQSDKRMAAVESLLS